MNGYRVELYSGLGYIEFIDAHGSDESIIEAARMSTEGRFKGWGPKTDGGPGDEKLLRFLWKKKHATPFEMAHAVFEIQAPVFVVRQVMRHRLFSYNELSARYTTMPDVGWLPEAKNVRAQNTTGNKQSSSGTRVESRPDQPSRLLLGKTPEGEDILNADWFIKELEDGYRYAFAKYKRMCDAGFAREQARAVVPMGVMTRWRQGGNLRCWLDFLSKRLPENAQAETREMAVPIADYLALRHPRTLALFREDLVE